MKNKKRKSKFKLKGMAAVYALMAILSLCVLINVIQIHVDTNHKRQELEELELQCQEQQIENDQLEDLLNNVDDEYIIRIAREELDFVFPGERVYKIRSGN